MSVLLLNRRISCFKWMALLVLAGGVACVQLSGMKKDKVAKDPSTNNATLGLIAVTLACCSSGCAGVYFEKILKGSTVTVWTRNLQLACYSIVIGLVGTMITADHDTIVEKGFFYGYTPITRCVILTQALGGLVIAMVIKHADNIIKNFATSLAIVLSCLVQFLFMDFAITPLFAVGVTLVLIAVYMYGIPAKAPPTPAYNTVPVTEEKNIVSTKLPV